MKNYFAPLLAEGTYHIYNRGVNGDAIFHTQENYRYFLQKLAEYIGDYTEIYAYCLMRNHFHLLLKVKNKYQVQVAFSKDIAEKDTNSQKFKTWKQNSEAEFTTDEIVTERFRSFFISYAKSLAKQTGRKGSLFQRPFKRLLVDNDAYFTQLVYYIHANPCHHNIMTDFHAYEWSSYKRHLIDSTSLLGKEQVLTWFHGKEKYIQFHTQQHREEDIMSYIIEED